jgi:hypothetical protein
MRNLYLEPDYPQSMVETITGLLAEYLVEDRGIFDERCTE